MNLFYLYFKCPIDMCINILYIARASIPTNSCYNVVGTIAYSLLSN